MFYNYLIFNMVTLSLRILLKYCVSMYETIGFAVLIYSHISILVHNREDTIQNHTSLLIKVLLKCFKLIFSSDATLPPCTPETCTIAYKLNKCGSNGIYSDT